MIAYYTVCLVDKSDPPKSIVKWQGIELIFYSLM